MCCPKRSVTHLVPAKAVLVASPLRSANAPVCKFIRSSLQDQESVCGAVERSALENIQAESNAPPGNLELMMLDLANFECGCATKLTCHKQAVAQACPPSEGLAGAGRSVKNFAKAFKEKHKKLDVRAPPWWSAVWWMGCSATQPSRSTYQRQGCLCCAVLGQQCWRVPTAS